MCVAGGEASGNKENVVQLWRSWIWYCKIQIRRNLTFNPFRVGLCDLPYPGMLPGLRNRVGGEGLFPSPSSHTTVRAVRHTAVCQNIGFSAFLALGGLFSPRISGTAIRLFFSFGRFLLPSPYSDIQPFSCVEFLPLWSVQPRFPLTMASADFCLYTTKSLSPVAALPLSRSIASSTDRPPRVRLYAFRSCSICIYVAIIFYSRGFCFTGNITLIAPPYMQFLSVCSNVCLQLLSDSQSPPTPLLFS